MEHRIVVHNTLCKKEEPDSSIRRAQIQHDSSQHAIAAGVVLVMLGVIWARPKRLHKVWTPVCVSHIERNACMWGGLSTDAPPATIALQP